MARTQKINVVIEVELRESEQILPRPSSADSDLTGDQSHEQTLLNALRDEPERYAEFVRLTVISSVEAYGAAHMLIGLARIQDTYTASLDVLEKLLPRLPQATQAHFQEGIEKGWISEGTDSVFNAVQAKPVSLAVEYPAPTS